MYEGLVNASLFFCKEKEPHANTYQGSVLNIVVRGVGICTYTTEVAVLQTVGFTLTQSTHGHHSKTFTFLWCDSHQ